MHTHIIRTYHTTANEYFPFAAISICLETNWLHHHHFKPPTRICEIEKEGESGREIGYFDMNITDCLRNAVQNYDKNVEHCN